jgi:tetratricopeptide (TPR) repeat protein
MARRDRGQKRKSLDHSQRMNHLKAKALSQVALEAWSFNQPYKTIALLNEAVRREPTNVTNLLNLATAYGRQRHYEKAEELLARLLELAPRKASTYHRAGQAFALIDRPERAAECYRRSLELCREKSSAVPTLLALSGLYERRHQLDQAGATIAEALGLDPANEQCQLQQAILHRRRGDTAQAESALRSLCNGSSHEWHVQSQAWYELAQLCDDDQRYGEAYQALVAAKQLLKPHAGPYRRENREMLVKNRQLVESLDPSCYDRWKDLAANDRAYRFAVLTSHPRSGTTLIEQVLGCHDEVISADEFDVFPQWVYLPIVRKFPYSQSILSILDRVPPAVRQQARATYWQQTQAIFDQPIGNRLLVDKNPAMTILLPVVNWAFPEMKMLIALRDPRDVILSCFMQKLRLNPISSNWLTLSDAADYYVQSMQTWLAVRKFTSSPWLEFRYEDVVADLESQARRILDFLGLAWDDKVLQFYDRAREKLVRSPTYKDVTQPVYQRAVGRWQHYAEQFEPILDKLQPFITEFGY